MVGLIGVRLRKKQLVIFRKEVDLSRSEPIWAEVSVRWAKLLNAAANSSQSSVSTRVEAVVLKDGAARTITPAPCKKETAPSPARCTKTCWIAALEIRFS